MSLIEETNDLFTELDEAILNLTTLQAETKETMDLIDLLLSKITDKLNLNGNDTSEKDVIVPERVIIQIENKITTLEELLEFAKKHGTPDPLLNANMNTKVLFDLIEPLEKINKIVGMSEIKNQILDLILTSMQGLYDPGTLYHTVITGPPGVGKTMLAKILGEIYLRLGILKNDQYIFKIARRSDLIGKYLGHTAIKTQELIDSCEGGVLFIDEVYSLGNEDKKDSFSKECIDTINLNLTEKENFICIIAGYPEEIEHCFFATNPGLKRRYPFRYEISDYNAEELSEIFLSKLTSIGWAVDIDKDIIFNFFKDNKSSFKYFGGDIDNLILNCKTCHSRRVFGLDEALRKILTIDDIICGFDKLEKSKPKNKESNHHLSMYL